MSKYLPVQKITNILGSVLFIIVPALLCFAETPQDDVYNQGYIVAKEEIPEKKKGTVIFSQGSSDLGKGIAAAGDETNLTALQKQARAYRKQALDLQRIGNIDAAQSLYEKATKIDPFYAAAFNDLGVIYETKGMIDEAEESYLQAIKLAPDYLSAYSNLALLYETRRDFDRALFYWRKRVELGEDVDPWTIKAKQHIADICLVLDRPNEVEILDLMDEVVSLKDSIKVDNKKLSQTYFDKSKIYYSQGSLTLALKYAINAYQLDPTNSEIKDFVTKLETRVLSQ